MTKKGLPWKKAVILFGCFAFAEIPSAIKNTDRFFKVDAVKASCARYLLCIAIPVASLALGALLLAILKEFNPAAVNYVMSAGDGSTNALETLRGMVCAPIFEEIAFRGMMLGKMKKRIPTWLALTVSAFLFGIWHRNLGQFAYTFAAGFIFGAAYLFTKRLRYAVFIHFVYNYVSRMALSDSGKGVIFDIPVLREFRKILMGLEIVPAILACLISSAIIVALLMLLRKVGELYSELKLKKEQTA